jgi:hypothetical protein
VRPGSEGLGDGTEPALRRHCCSLAHGCTFHRVGADIFVCERTGRAHVCDHACRERVVDMDGRAGRPGPGPDPTAHTSTPPHRHCHCQPFCP